MKTVPRKDRGLVKTVPREDRGLVKVQQRRLPVWLVSQGPFGVRLFDVAIVALVIAVIEVNVIEGGGPGAVPLNATAYLFGALLAVPIAFRHRWPFPVLLVSAAAMLLYYIFARRNISPAPLFFVPLYDAAVVGYLAVAIAIPAVFMVIGLFVVEASTRQGFAALTAEFLSQIVILALAVMLGEVVRSRRALTAETAQRLRLADTERAAAAGRVIAEERLRIARELHDTVAHSMATITVQAGSALHLLGPSAPGSGSGSGSGSAASGSGSAAPGSGSAATGFRRGVDAETLRAALTAIRETSKGALTDMRSVLGQLRHSDQDTPGSAADTSGSSAGTAPGSVPGTASGANPGTAGTASGPAGWKGLANLDALRDAVTAAGARVRVDMEGTPRPLSAEADHAAYRILQESLTNVLRHAGPAPAAQISLCYQREVLVITITDDGPVTADGGGSDGHGASARPGPRATNVENGLGGQGPGGRGFGGQGPGGHGIGGMRERAASVGGELTAGPRPGGGFQVTAALPTLAQAALAQAALAQATGALANGSEPARSATERATTRWDSS